MFTPNKNANVADYNLNAERILLMLRYPKYINMIKKRFGDDSEMIVEEVLQRGYWTASELLLKVFDRLTKNNQNVSLTELKDKFISLATATYLIRIPYNEDEDKPIPQLKIEDKELHAIPNININELVSAKQTGVKFFSDNGIYWTVNFDRFHQDMRDKIIISAFNRKFDENAGELIKYLLQQMYVSTKPWVDVSNPIPILAIKEMVRRQPNMTELNTYFDDYIRVIGKFFYC